MLIFCRDKESGQDAASGRNPPSLYGSPAITKDTASKEPSPDGDDTDGAAVAPRVKLAADGSIILDEERFGRCSVHSPCSV